MSRFGVWPFALLVCSLVLAQSTCNCDRYDVAIELSST